MPVKKKLRLLMSDDSFQKVQTAAGLVGCGVSEFIQRAAIDAARKTQKDGKGMPIPELRLVRSTGRENVITRPRRDPQAVLAQAQSLYFALCEERGVDGSPAMADERARLWKRAQELAQVE